MKVATVLGTRPEIIRLSLIIPRLDSLCDHLVVHTGQNYDPALSERFFAELGLRAPDRDLGVRAEGFGAQLGAILAGIEPIFRAERPDRLLVLGDTNSGLAALVAKRLGIRVFHLEAGNRCYDDRVPEEVNRRAIDHASDVLLPYSERSRMNLLREGIEGRRIFVVGNPIYEVIRHHEERIEASRALAELGLAPGGFFLVTLHREESVDVEPRLRSLVAGLRRLHREHGLPVVCSVHPRTRDRLARFGVELDGGGVRGLPPFGFCDFLALARNARCVVTDSGTVQEECALSGVPSVIARDVTERPETLERGANVLAGADPEQLALAVRVTLAGEAHPPPPEYLVPDVSDVVVKLVLGYVHA